MQVIRDLQNTLWHTHPWSGCIKMEVYVDVPSQGYGAILLGDSKIEAIFSCSSNRQQAHSSTSEVESLVRTLRAFKPFLLGQQFTVFSDNWSVLRILHGNTMQAPILRRWDEIMYWYPKIQFIEGKANGIANWLSGHPMVKWPITPKLPRLSVLLGQTTAGWQ